MTVQSRSGTLKVMNSADWAALRSAEFTLPDHADLPTLVEAAFTLLASPEATARDDWAHAAPATWLASGRVDEHLEEMGERASRMPAASEVLARNARVRHLGEEPLRAWQGAWARWSVQEHDLRDWVAGWDGCTPRRLGRMWPGVWPGIPP